MRTHTSKPNYSYSTKRAQERKKKESRQIASRLNNEPSEQEELAEPAVGEWGSITSNVMRTIENGEYQPDPGWEQHMAQPGKARGMIANIMRTAKRIPAGSQQNDYSISSPHQTEGIQLRAATPTVPEPSRPPAFQLKARPIGLPGDSMIQEKGEKTDAPTVSLGIQRPNQTGLPNNLKAGIENLSGYSMDDVKVHYNSSKPAQLQALAYTQGTEIHLAPGQERHLTHEAWHVVQQKQRIIKPTIQMKGIAINDDLTMEKEADVMGRKALTIGSLTNGNDKRKGKNCELIEKETGGAQFNSPLITQFTNLASSIELRVGQIYGIYHNKNGDGVVEEDDIVYVGKTNQKDYGSRFVQHVDEDDGAPWYGMPMPDDIDTWEYVPRMKWEYKQITDFDVAVAEQYYMQEAREKVGDQLLNHRNEIKLDTFNAGKNNPHVFTTAADYKGWKPVNILKM